MSRIGENIKELRLRHGMSQEDLANMIGKSRSAVSMYESGEIVPRMGVIEDMARIFSVSKSEILGESMRFDGLTNDENELLNCYRSVKPWERELILNNARMVFMHTKGENGESNWL